jgi:hypothetical protein
MDMRPSNRRRSAIASTVAERGRLKCTLARTRLARSRPTRSATRTGSEKAHAAGDYACVFAGHIYESAWQVRGYEPFLIDLLIRGGFHKTHNTLRRRHLQNHQIGHFLNCITCPLSTPYAPAKASLSPFAPQKSRVHPLFWGRFRKDLIS